MQAVLEKGRNFHQRNQETYWCSKIYCSFYKNIYIYTWNAYKFRVCHELGQLKMWDESDFVSGELEYVTSMWIFHNTIMYEYDYYQGYSQKTH